MKLQDKDLRKKTIKPGFCPSAKLLVQATLITDVLDENGQLQVKPPAFDEQLPPYLQVKDKQGSMRKIKSQW